MQGLEGAGTKDRVPPTVWHLLARPSHMHSPPPAHSFRCLSGLMVAGLLRAGPAQLSSCNLSLVRGVTGDSGVPLPQPAVFDDSVRRGAGGEG